MSSMASAPRHDSLVNRASFLTATGLSDLELDKELRAKQLFAVEQNGDAYLPAFFLDERYGRRELQSICKLLDGLPSGSKLQFFTTPKGSLNGKTPLGKVCTSDR